VERAPGHKVACHFPIKVEDLPKRVEVQALSADAPLDATPDVDVVSTHDATKEIGAAEEAATEGGAAEEGVSPNKPRG